MKRINIFYTLVLFIMTGCSGTYITSTWKAPGVVPKTYNKIIVVGIIREADQTIKYRMEDHLVGDLKALGYNAVSAFQVYGPKSLRNLSRNDVHKKLARDGYDAVLTIVLLDKQKERYYVPGRVLYTPYITYQGHFYGYYNSISSRIETPGYYQESTKYFWESNLYDLSTDMLVYSVQTQSFESASTEGLAHQYGKMIVKNMEKNNVLVQQQLASP